MSEKFNAKKHLIQLKGKWYLETKHRIQWFREDHPRGCISTELVSTDPIIVKATIYNGEGAVLATAHAGAVDKGNAVWSGRGVEKSETAAIGRALAHAGYGTQFVEDDEAESGFLADSPVGRSTQRRDIDPTTGEVKGNAPQFNRPQSNGKNSDDLRDKEVASRFIQRWRKQALSDNDVLAALGVSRLSEWTKGRKAADEAVNAWLAGKLTQETV